MTKNYNREKLLNTTHKKIKIMQNIFSPERKNKNNKHHFEIDPRHNGMDQKNIFTNKIIQSKKNIHI